MASTTSGLVANATDYEKLGLSPTALDLILGLTTPRGDASEDCLTLNIWTKPQVGEAKKAVLLFIYGGGYVSGMTRALLSTKMTKCSWFAGSSAIPWYDGATLADEDDVVVVTFKYCYSFP